LEKQYPSQADRLYRMLWGYTNEGLGVGEDADLVKALEDENLPVRLLSSWNLRDITGQGGWVYRPEETAAKRQAGMQGWRTRLDKKQIRFKSAEEKTSSTAHEKPAAAEPKPDSQ
jgi:SH3-like domain-containing protein